MSQAIVNVQNSEKSVTQQESNEKRIRAFIEACILIKPELKDRLTLPACVLYLQLPDTTWGWDAYKEQGKPMPLEYKFACLMPTITNGLTPGDIIWLGNRPYARADAYRAVAKRDLVPVTGLKYRPLTDDEVKMYAIGEKDMALMVEQQVFDGKNSYTIEGLGIIGADESQPNHKGNYKVARELVRDRAQFVRTRAERDMYRRAVTIQGAESEDNYEAPKVVAEQPTLQNFFESKKEADDKAHDEAMVAWLLKLRKTVEDMGGVLQQVIPPGAHTIEVEAAFLEEWIKANTPPPPEPEKQAKPAAKRTKKITAEPKDTLIISGKDLGPIGKEVPTLDSSIDDQNPARKDANVTAAYPETVEAQEPSIVIDEQYTDSEIREIENMELDAHFSDFDFPSDEPLDPLFEARDDQKNELVKAMRQAGVPDDKGFFLALSGAMRGQPMSKLTGKLEALKQNYKMPAAQSNAAPANSVPRPSAARGDFMKLTAKLTKLGAKIDEIIGRNHMDLMGNGSDAELKEAIDKLDAWYQKILTGKK